MAIDKRLVKFREFLNNEIQKIRERDDATLYRSVADTNAMRDAYVACRDKLYYYFPELKNIR